MLSLLKGHSKIIGEKENVNELIWFIFLFQMEDDNIEDTSSHPFFVRADCKLFFIEYLNVIL